MSDFSAQRDLLRALFDAALAAADPARCLPPHLPVPPAGRTVVVGAGKAAAAMARAVEAHWRGDPARLSGLVVTRYGHGYGAGERKASIAASAATVTAAKVGAGDTASRAGDRLGQRIEAGAESRCEARVGGRIEIVEAAHPVPDAAGLAAAQRQLAAVRGLGADDLVLVLLSGGGSALLAAPAPWIGLDDKRAVTRALLASGAAIDEINCVRKHLSALKGGRLALAAAPARVLTLAISDVPGDVPSTIASGPTVADPTTCAEALAIVVRYGVALPEAARAALLSGEAETPKPGDPRFARSELRIVATARAALEAAAELARQQGVTPLLLGDAIEGEAREAARVFAGMARSCAVAGQPLAPPCVLLSGGETTVSVHGKGRGGRNSEFLLGLALALHGAPGIHALAADTDGIDGSEDNAGAFVFPDTLQRVRAAGLDPRARLGDNDAYAVFAAVNDLLVTGPTRTNVNDFRAILIERRG